MNIENIKEKLVVAKEEVNKLEQKKIAIENKITAKQEQIDRYALQISQYEMDELLKMLKENGTTLSEVLQAMQRGEFNHCDEK